VEEIFSGRSNATDSLDGGGGTDTLSLFGAGTFDLSALAQFTGFEVVNLTNSTGGFSNLNLRNGVSGLTVNVDNQTGNGGSVNLADGTVTVNLGTSTGQQNVNAGSGTATINASNYARANLSTGTATVNFAGYGEASLSSGKATVTFGNAGTVYIQNVGSINSDDALTTTNISSLYIGGTTLDLAQLHLGGMWGVTLGYGNSATVDLDQATLAHITSFAGYSAPGHVRTAAATLDLTGKSVSSGVDFASTNATGTTFTVNDVNAGLRVIGGVGNDTLINTGTTHFTAAQRNAIFSGGSVETIIDDGTTYQAPVVSFTLTTGTDTFVGTGADDTVNGSSSSTLNVTCH
jgi:hypothetical protein